MACMQTDLMVVVVDIYVSAMEHKYAGVERIVVEKIQQLILVRHLVILLIRLVQRHFIPI